MLFRSCEISVLDSTADGSSGVKYPGKYLGLAEKGTKNKEGEATVEDDRVKPFDGITLIYAGNPAKKDCIHSVINAVNTLANEGKAIRFLILGTTRGAYMKQYAQLLLSTSLHENVKFLGRVSQDLIPAYYKKADFMVLLREPNRKSKIGRASCRERV